MSSSKSGIKRVKDALESKGYTNEIVKLPDSTRTAVEAAKAIDCEVAQIAKSLIFLCVNSDLPLLIIASGINRVDEQKIADHIQEPLGKANADFVREQTGFVIGGVPPLGHKHAIKTIIDEDLLQYDEIWAAAGHPKAVFRLTPEDLIRLTGGEVLSIQ
ncbi:MAG TPA: YbaK/EbsC family protein [Bacillales bacterium]|nr:YbaK/EbsC family protein [Bacillales bacterium]